ncbi:hypothetical protein R5R35_002645 [Gryllus longicercus]|uniref:BAG family molecular chaperone regulator 3 n=1 Tax=Gryllus longicercus TaxID=2509291 RepID=A0AAN9VZ48_9ORTH
MADDGGGPLPPGWDRKYDHRTGRYYFINYFNKTTTWEDPRSRYRQLNQVTPQHVPAPTMVENIPLQPLRGARSYPMYSDLPSISLPKFPPPPHRHTMVHFQDMTAVRPSPIPGRVAATMGPARGTPFSSPARSTNATVESSLSTDPDVAVAKIGAMFPTVSDTHIRTLLMKYHNREAVVVSALQVEKHPLSTPGPYATPPAAARRPGHMLWEGPGSRSGSPAPRPPHSSPKMKLRYLKSVFPKVEETLLLDILSNSDNNVQKATEKLQTMGFEKRDTPPPRLTLRGKSEESNTSQPRPTAQPTPPPRMKSVEEKQKMKVRLQERHKDVPERVVGIALDSVDYDEDRASQILQFMVQEEQRSQASSSQQRSGSTDSKQEGASEADVKPSPESSASRSTPRKSESPARKPLIEKSPAHTIQKTSPVSATAHAKRPKNKKDVPKMSRGTCTAEDAEYRSPYLSKASGPNPDLHLGANDELLLADYMTWSGPNPELLQTPSPRSSLAKGPDPTLLGERTYKPRGPNAELRKGPLRGLAKGSIYSRLTASATDQVCGESRGK